MNADYRQIEPDAQGRGFDMLERDLERGWTDDAAARHAERSRAPGEVREEYNPESVTARENANRPMDPAADLSDRHTPSEPEERL